MKTYAPNFDGVILDCVVDYLTWTFIPALFMYRAGLLGDGVIAIVLLALINVTSMFCYEMCIRDSGLAGARRALQHFNVLEGHGPPSVRRDDPDPTSREAGVDPDKAQSQTLLVALELSLHLGGEIEVREHVLHVVAVFERVDQAEHLASGVGVDLDLQVRHELCVCGLVVDTGLNKGGAHGNQVACLGDDLDRLTLSLIHI